MTYSRKLVAALAASVCVVAYAAPAYAQVREYNIGAGSLKSALDAYARQSGRQVIYKSDEVRSVRSPGVKGALSADAALERLLAGTGFTVRGDPSGAIAIVRSGNGQAVKGGNSTSSAGQDTAGSAAATGEGADIVVSGTRIRTGRTSSPVTVVTAADIRQGGHRDLGDVIRSLPQNFNGGQNPGVQGVVGGGPSDFNFTGGSALNLRGLGPSATLTLLNGRRMAYGGSSQSVDISAIPVDAVDRIDVVADGASAIYGSDAVGGVGNVVLRRDFEGLAVGFRYGGATRGGLESRDYSAVAGTKWNSGGVIGAFKRAQGGAIFASQRDYTSSLGANHTLIPTMDTDSGVVSFHQRIGGVLTFSVDGLFLDRSQRSLTSFGALYSDDQVQTSTRYLSPSLTIELPSQWRLSLGAAWGRDRTNYASTAYFVGSPTAIPAGDNCYCNTSVAYDAGLEGPLFAMAGGDARLAIGAGYRKIDYDFRNNVTNTSTINGSEDNKFAYAELYLPVLARGDAAGPRPMVSVTAAIRVEDYSSFQSVATPKFGIIFDPAESFTIKGSWGRSFKAPTLQQRFAPLTAVLDRSTQYTGSAFPAGSTVLRLTGGNPDLGPERASIWTVTAQFHPVNIPEWRAEASWFDISYRDRVETPIPNISQALASPIYVQFVELSPSSQRQAALIAGLTGTFSNFAGAPYDPSKVVAIVRNRPLNVASVSAHGFDFTTTYRLPIPTGSINLQASLTYIDSSRKITSAAPSQQLAGTLYNPAHIRARAGSTLLTGGFSASVFANYTSESLDTIANRRTDSYATFDITLRYTVPAGSGILSNLDISASAQNVFDKPPPLYTPSIPNVVPYDSTNYSAVGRFVSVGISKRF